MMSSKITLMLGLIVMFIPYIGLPRELENPLHVAIGALIILFALVLNHALRQRAEKEPPQNDVYVERKPMNDNIGNQM